MGFEASQKMNKAKNPPGSAVAPRARGGSDSSFGDAAAGGNTNRTNAASGMHITTTARGQAMVAKVLRAKRGKGGAQFDGTTYGDSKPSNAALSSSKGPSGGYSRSENVNSNMDYSGKNKRTQKNPSKGDAI